LHTSAIGVVVATNSIVRVFDDGEIVGEIFPELRIGRESIYITNPLIDDIRDKKITVVARA